MVYPISSEAWVTSLQKWYFTTRKYTDKENQVGQKYVTISTVEENEEISFPQLGKEMTEDMTGV